VKLTLEEVRHVAALARLALTPQEEELYRDQLSAILDAVDQLKSLNTENIEPTSHATGGDSPLREDVVESCLDPAKALANAPAKVGTSFAVPSILE
jgi:aspartyl-tRNA(Asn)/glutamyl-tRNA(Gln) amidotransferase subunit C